MGILSKLTKAIGLSREMNVEDFMTASEAEEVDVLHQQADFYVKPVSLASDSDVKLVEEELKQRNIILLNVSPMAKQPNKLKQMIDNIKLFVQKNNGDIARLDENKILLTPSKVKIVKSRKK